MNETVNHQPVTGQQGEQALKKIEFTKARDFGAIINDSFSFIRQNFRVLFKSLIFIVGPLMVVLAVLYGLYNVENFARLAEKNSGKNIFAGVLTAKYGLMMLLSIVSYTLITLIACEYIVLYIESPTGEVSFEDVWRDTKRDFFLLLFTNIGNFFLILFSVLLLIVPGIYFMVVISLVPMIRVRERIGYFASIKRSMKLISGNWWSTFGIILIMGIIVLAMGWVLGVPSGAVMFLAMFHKADAASPLYQFLFMAAGLVNQFYSFLSVLVLVATVFQYFNLIEMKEGTGLLKKIEEIRKDDGA